MLFFYNPWKYQETFSFSDVLRGYRKATLGCNGVKITKRFERPLFSDRWYLFTTIFIISLLHSHLFCTHDVVTLLGPYQLLQISIFSVFLNNTSQVFVGSKHTFVQHPTISLLSDVSATWRIAQCFNICYFVLVLFVTRFVSCTC